MKRDTNINLLLIFFFLSCGQVGKKDRAILPVSKQDSSFVSTSYLPDTFSTSNVSKDIITNRTFTLQNDENFYSAIDSQQVIIEESGKFYFLRPSSGQRVSLTGLNKFYDGGEEHASIVVNNAGEQKFLYSMYHPISCDLNGRGIKSCGKFPEEKHEFIIEDADKVYFDRGTLLLHDSVVDIYGLNNYKLIVKSKGNFLYSIIDSNLSSHYFMQLNIAKIGIADTLLYGYLINHFHVYNKLFFQKLTKEEDKIAIITYDLTTGETKKYIIPFSIRRLIPAKDCFYIEYFNNEHIDSRYSYVDYSR